MALNNFPYKILVKRDTTDVDDIDLWCKEKFGPGGFQSQWDVGFADESPYNYDLFYYFKEEKDAVLFALRWV